MEGFIDEEGFRVFIIRKVLKYKPAKGYLIDWLGFGPKDRTWNLPKDMPKHDKEIQTQMRSLRIKYKKQLATHK